ncbi:MAG: FAD-dependent oxidoreductase, partial [Defluviitaleaceae bacterium]|nr:FAD-dependent oxidoreductase [Defluviitaleaceae bacterium]
MSVMYDLIVIGAGAAGLSAAIFAGRARLHVLVVENTGEGGKLKLAAEVSNPDAFTAGEVEIAADMKKEAVNFGVDFVAANVQKVDFKSDIKSVKIDTGNIYTSWGLIMASRASVGVDFVTADLSQVSFSKNPTEGKGSQSSWGVIIAMGSKPKTLGFEGEEEFTGRGVAYSATCDGEFFTGRDVFVIGSGFSAAEESIYLTRFARKVTVIVKGPKLTCEQDVADRVLNHEKIEIKYNTEIVHVRGANVVKEAKFKDIKTGEEWEHKVDEGTFGVFIMAGYETENDEDFDNLDDIYTQTAVPEITGSNEMSPQRRRQLVIAASDGAVSSEAAVRYVAEIKARLGVEDFAHAKEAKHTTYGLSDESISSQIRHVMERCENDVTIHAVLLPDCTISANIKEFLEEYRDVTERMPIKITQKGDDPAIEANIGTDVFPIIALLDSAGQYTGVGFLGVPGGHELESFILAIYNAAGPGQATPASMKEQIENLQSGTRLKVGVSLTCTLCSELVQNCQRIAIINKNIKAEMIDMQYFAELRDKFDIMSVPALIINDETVLFGRKSMEDLLLNLPGGGGGKNPT